jgi:hypothetical protein
MHVFALWFCWFVGLWSAVVLNVSVGAEVCCIAVGNHGQTSAPTKTFRTATHRTKDKPTNQ